MSTSTGVKSDFVPFALGALVHVVESLFVRGENAVLAARLDRHVGDGHAVVHVHGIDAGALVLERTIGRAVGTDLADDVQDDVLGHDTLGHGSFKIEAHRLRNLDEQFAGAHDEAGVGVADAGGEHVERARHAGVAVGTEEDFTGTGVALGRERGVADARVTGAVLLLELPFGGVENPVTVLVIDDVVEIRQTLFLHKIAKDIDVAVGKGIGGEDVVIGNDDDLGLVPDFRFLAELALEDTDRAWSAYIVGQENIGAHPYILTRGHMGLATGTGEQFFSQRHRG